MIVVVSFAEPIWASGHCAASTGRTHDRRRTAVRSSSKPLAPQGPSTHAVRYSYGQGPYRQGQQRGYDDPRDGYEQDRYGGQGSRRYDERERYGDQDRFGQGGGRRGGSFQQSCGDIQQNGNTLSAVCDDGRGRRFATSIDTRRCGRSDIGNQRGILQCGNVRGNGRPLD